MRGESADTQRVWKQASLRDNGGHVLSYILLSDKGVNAWVSDFDWHFLLTTALKFKL